MPKSKQSFCRLVRIARMFFFVGLPFPTVCSDGGQGLCDVNECEQPADTYDCKCWSSILTTWV